MPIFRRRAKPSRDGIPEHKRCLACGKGTCRCRATAAKDRKAVAGTKAWRVCGQHLSRTGATCRQSVKPGETCANPGHWD